MRVHLVAASFWMLGCSRFQAQRHDLDRGGTMIVRRSAETLVEVPKDARPIAKLLILGDSQFHHLYGKRTFAQSGWVDKNVEVAIRPVALDVSSDLLFEEFLRYHDLAAPDHLLVHLGDVADLSCLVELHRFLAVMQRAGYHTPGARSKRPWLTVTSNHDGFFVGNFTQSRDLDGALKYTDMPMDWRRACSVPGDVSDRILTKGRFVSAVLEVLRPEVDPADLAADTQGKDDPNSYYTDHLYYARRLDDGATHAVLYGLFLDTVDYRQDIDLTETSGAGVVGGISNAQLAFFRARIASHERQHPGKRLYYVLFGHHPYAGLHEDAQKRFQDLLSALGRRAIAYVAGHTHRASLEEIERTDGQVLPEIRNGSTLDFPQEGREIVIAYAPGRDEVSIQTSLLGFAVESCAGSPRDYDGALGYMTYARIRDRVPRPSRLGVAWNELFGAHDLRIATLTNALEIEHQMARQLAKLYLGVADPTKTSALERIVREPLPRPATHLDAYARWFDPKTLPDSPLVASRLYSMGRLRDTFEEFETRRTDARLRRYFVCHALAAAEAESRSRTRKSGVILVR